MSRISAFERRQIFKFGQLLTLLIRAEVGAFWEVEKLMFLRVRLTKSYFSGFNSLCLVSIFRVRNLNFSGFTPSKLRLQTSQLQLQKAWSKIVRNFEILTTFKCAYSAHETAQIWPLGIKGGARGYVNQWRYCWVSLYSASVSLYLEGCLPVFVGVFK